MVADLATAGAAFLVVADEQFGRQIPFAFLERVRAEFQEKFADRGRTATAHSLDNSVGCVPCSLMARMCSDWFVLSRPAACFPCCSCEAGNGLADCVILSAGQGSNSTWNFAQNTLKS